MNKIIKNAQQTVLKILSGKIDDFCLGGGTALSLFYFRHRESFDLDFFSRRFANERVYEIIEFLANKLKKEVKLTAEQTEKNRAKIAVYSVSINTKDFLKIDFIQDFWESLKSPKKINGINVFSLEDIYIRKIYAITGAIAGEDIIGRNLSKGGRTEAKDFFDLYHLSHTFLRLSQFCFKYGDSTMRELLIRCFRTYSRMDIKTGLMELDLNATADYALMERHFKKEIDKIIDKEVEFL